MTDPERLVDRPPSELGALLLQAGTEEGPSQKSLQRTLSALGVGVSALGAASSASALGAAGTASAAAGTAASAATGGVGAAGSVGAAVLAKWLGVGVVSGIAVSLAVHGVSEAEHDVPAAAVSTASGAAMSAPSAVASEAALVPRALEAELAAPEPSASARETKPSRVVAEVDAAPLAAEVAFVDRGRAAYQRGDWAAAERALAGYEREFPEPRLWPEVLYLRMEIATQRGERARAVALAQRILRQHARSPHAARAGAVLRGE